MLLRRGRGGEWCYGMGAVGGGGDGILIYVTCAAMAVSRPMVLLLRAVCASVVLPQPGSVLMSMARVTIEDHSDVRCPRSSLKPC